MNTHILQDALHPNISCSFLFFFFFFSSSSKFLPFLPPPTPFFFFPFFLSQNSKCCQSFFTLDRAITSRFVQAHTHTCTHAHSLFCAQFRLLASGAWPNDNMGSLELYWRSFWFSGSQAKLDLFVKFRILYAFPVIDGGVGSYMNVIGKSACEYVDSYNNENRHTIYITYIQHNTNERRGRQHRNFPISLLCETISSNHSFFFNL